MIKHVLTKGSMKTVIGNWKMNVGVRESVALARGVLYALRGKEVVPDVVICPSYTALSEVRKVVTRSSISLGAQNIHWEEKGSFTGEISARMLEEVGVSHVIVGHSERRQLFGETDEMVQKKVRQITEKGFIPVLCVGETKEQRDAGQEKEVIKEQISSALSKDLPLKKKTIFIAYEPIWAIGTGKAATVTDATEMHAYIREIATGILGRNSATIHVLYGGSVDGDNAYSFLRETEVDGILVGGASVKLTKMREVLEAATEAVEGELEN